MGLLHNMYSQIDEESYYNTVMQPATRSNVTSNSSQIHWYLQAISDKDQVLLN